MLLSYYAARANLYQLWQLHPQRTHAQFAAAVGSSEKLTSPPLTTNHTTTRKIVEKRQRTEENNERTLEASGAQRKTQRNT